jgi:hypothetical protein
VPVTLNVIRNFDICNISAIPKVVSKSDHMKKLPPRGFGVTMNPQEKKTKRR